MRLKELNLRQNFAKWQQENFMKIPDIKHITKQLGNTNDFEKYLLPWECSYRRE